MDFFPLSLLHEVTSNSEPVLFSTCVAACTIFVFMNWFLLYIGQQLINLTSVFITIFVKYFSAIFKNITQALYKQKRHWKVKRNVYLVKKSPTKMGSGIYERENPVTWGNLFSYKEILIFQLNSLKRQDLA